MQFAFLWRIKLFGGGFLMLEAILIRILGGAGAKILGTAGVKALGVLFNDVFGLNLNPGDQEILDALNEIDQDLDQISTELVAIEDELDQLSQQLTYVQDVVVNEINRLGMQPYLDKINLWYGQDYRKLSQLAAQGKADLDGVDNLVSAILDNDSGIEVVLFSLNTFIVGDQVEGTLKSTVDTLISGRGDSDPLPAYQYYQSWFLSLIWAQVQGLMLMVDAMNYLAAHPERQSARTRQAAQVTWPGSALDYCLEVFVPKLQNQVQVFLSCVEKFAASVKKSTPDPHRFLPESVDSILFQADLLAHEAGGFMAGDGQTPSLQDALVVRLVGSPGWVDRLGQAWTASLVQTDGTAKALPLAAVDGYDLTGKLVPLRQFDAHTLYPAWVLDPRSDRISFNSFTTPNQVEFGKYLPSSSDLPSLDSASIPPLKLPAPFDGETYQFTSQAVLSGKDQQGNPVTSYFHQLVVCEPYMSANLATSWTSLEQSLTFDPSQNCPIQVDKREWYTGLVDGYPECGYNLNFTIERSDIYQAWHYTVTAKTGLNLLYQSQTVLPSLVFHYQVSCTVQEKPDASGEYKDNDAYFTTATLPPQTISLDLKPKDSNQHVTAHGSQLQMFNLNQVMPASFFIEVTGSAQWSTEFWSGSRTFNNLVQVKVTDCWLALE